MFKLTNVLAFKNTALKQSSAPILSSLKFPNGGIENRDKYLYDTYSHILKTKPLVLVCHDMPLSKKDDTLLRQAIFKEKFTKFTLKSSIMRLVLLDNYFKKHNITEKELQLNFTNKREIFEEKSPFSCFFNNNSTSLIYYNENDLHPDALNKLLKMLGKKNSPFKNQVLIMGMILENNLDKLYTLDDMTKLKDSPTLPQSHSILVQMLQQQVGGVSSLLQRSTTGLNQTLQTYHDEVLGGAKKEDVAETKVDDK
ncbi:hypothetical protein QEN19_002073 [Hanseniaspora menglaensis]